MAKMSYEAFINEVAEQIKDYLPGEYENSNVSLDQRVGRNDEMRRCLVVKRPDTTISPILYLESYYKEYNGDNFDEIMIRIADVYAHNDNRKMDNVMDIIGSIREFDKIKDRIIPRLLNREMNKDYIKDKPFTTIDDFVVTYHISLDTEKSVPITNELADIYGVTLPDLYKLAMENVEKLYPHTFSSMNEVLIEMMLPDLVKNGMEREEARAYIKDMFLGGPMNMYVLSNTSKMYGAVTILNSDVMDSVRETMGEDFYIIPSSIHEVIIIPRDMGKSDIEQMITEVNEGQVLPEERLSYYVYGYNPDAKQIYRVAA